MQQAGKSRGHHLGVILFFTTLLTGFGIWAAILGRGASFRKLTGWHHAAADYFFRYFTHLGDGIFILALAALMALFRKYYLSVGIVMGYLLSGLLAQLCKRLLPLPRPKAFFQALGEAVYQVPGVEVHLAGSFPSGHTASSFALAIFLILFLSNRFFKWVILLAAILVGYSRIYLSQHFPIDVWGGAVLGTLSGAFVYWFLEKRKGRLEIRD